MASLQTPSLLFSSSCSCSSIMTINYGIHVPKLPRVRYLVPQATKVSEHLVLELNRSIDTNQLDNNHVLKTQTHDVLYKPNESSVTIQLYAILEAVADRIQVHNNVCDQRKDWNALLLNSINMITLTATTMVGVAAAAANNEVGGPPLALKLSSALLFSAATGLLLIMNRIQPSQLAEEQRNATRLFKQLQTQIQNTIALGNATEKDVKGAMEKVLALDKAYPLPLIGVMLEKYPTKFKPAVWWPSTQFQKKNEGKARSKKMEEKNGWSEELEMEMWDVVEVVKRKDIEDYDRLGNIAMKVNKSLAIAGPLMTGIAATCCGFVGNGSSFSALVTLMAGSMTVAINTFEHGGQVGMVFEMYRNTAGFFNKVEASIESTLEENDMEKRENGELFEMKMALQLGRSVSELRELASKCCSCRMEGMDIDEFASKLF